MLTRYPNFHIDLGVLFGSDAFPPSRGRVRGGLALPGDRGRVLPVAEATNGYVVADAARFVAV